MNMPDKDKTADSVADMIIEKITNNPKDGKDVIIKLCIIATKYMKIEEYINED